MTSIAPVTLTRMQKLIKAEMFGRRQLRVLDIRINELDKRLKICKERGPKSLRYMLRQRKRVVENVRHMYGIYVQRKTMAVARMILHNFAASTLGGLNRNSESDNDPTEEQTSSADSSLVSSEDSNSSSDAASDIEIR